MAVGCLQRPKSNQQQQRETLSKRASNSLPQCNTKRVVFTCRYHLLLGGLSHQQNKALEVLTIAINRTRYLICLTINQPSCLFESNHPRSFVFWGALACFFCHQPRRRDRALGEEGLVHSCWAALRFAALFYALQARAC